MPSSSQSAVRRTLWRMMVCREHCLPLREHWHHLPHRPTLFFAHLEEIDRWGWWGDCRCLWARIHVCVCVCVCVCAGDDLGYRDDGEETWNRANDSGSDYEEDEKTAKKCWAAITS